MLQIVFGKFYKQIKKKQWWRHHDVILCFWDLKISNFVKHDMGYHVAKFQISWFSGSNFMEVSVRPQNTIMTSLWRHF